MNEDSPLLHQVSLTDSEVIEIFDKAPAGIPQHLWIHQESDRASTHSSTNAQNKAAQLVLLQMLRMLHSRS